MAATSSGRWGAAWTASTYTRASPLAATIPGRSGTAPTALDAAVTAIQRVRSDNTASTADAGRSSVSRSGSAKRTVAPARSAAINHGATLPSWSSRVQTISSPGSSVRPIAAANASVSVVMLGPKTTPRGSPPTNRPATVRASSMNASRRSAAWNAPPWLATMPERRKSAIASMGASTGCAPAGASSLAQPSASPGKRSRFIPGTVAAGGGARPPPEAGELLDVLAALERERDVHGHAVLGDLAVRDARLARHDIDAGDASDCLRRPRHGLAHRVG